jgi:hypothetical protein
LPAKSGLRPSNSAKVQPADHTSIVPQNAKRGQSVLTLTTRGSVKSGIIEFSKPGLIETSLIENETPYGATLITTFGDVLGMHIGTPSESGASFVSSQIILNTLALYDAVQLAEGE